MAFLNDNTGENEILSDLIALRIYNQIPNPLLIFKPDKMLIFANKAALQLTGYTSEELINTKPPYPFWPQSMLIGYEQNIDKELFNGYQGECLYTSKEGRPFWVKILVSSVEKNDSLKYFMVSWIDITERKNAEEALKESEEKLRLIFDNSPAEIDLWDAEGKLIVMNRTGMNIQGISSLKDVEGLNLFNDPFIKAEDKARLKLGESIYIDSFVDFDTVNALKRFKSNKKGVIQLERVILPLINSANGQITGFLSQAQDITQRKRMEANLKTSEARFRSIFENSPVGSILRDAQGETVIANQTILDIRGIDNEEELRKVNIFKDPRMPPDVKIRLQSGKMVKYEQTLDFDDFKKATGFNIHKTGLCYIERVITPLKNAENDAISGYLVQLQDISDRKLSEAKALETEALKKLDKAKSELLANVSHELRTPLASIKGFIETLIEPDVSWSREQQLEFLNSANQQADHLTLLIQDLLDMSRLDSGHLAVQRQVLPVSEIVDTARTILTSITAKHQLQIKLSPDIPMVQADKTRIAQVITNLVENAVKFSKEGTPIRLSIRGTKNKVIFSVRDWGEGISEEVEGNLFNRFYQAERVVSGKTKGTGLGLAISKGIIEAHGGTIWLDKRTRHGAKFSFSLPAAGL